MLPRRHIRIKVFQSLYTLAQQDKDYKFDFQREFNNNLESYKSLYFFIINLLKILRDVAKEEIKIKKTKLIPSEEDLKPNTKFIKNTILNKINNQHKSGHIEKEKEKIHSIIKNIFQQVKKSKKYIDYMNTETTKNDEEKSIILFILKKYVIINEKIHDIIEDYSIYWNDDLIVIYNLILEKINNNKSINTIKLFRKKDDEVFAEKLIQTTIDKEHDTSLIIYSLAKNWDKERIALSDLILMRMAITEISYLKNIPHKVTLDEYIEISKEYSTPKSNEFINGILDVFIKDNLGKKIKE